MTLNKQKKELFIEWLKDHNANIFKCQICNQGDFVILDEIIYLSGATGSYQNVGVACTNCKNTLLFEISNSGIMDK